MWADPWQKVTSNGHVEGNASGGKSGQERMKRNINNIEKKKLKSPGEEKEIKMREGKCPTERRKEL